MILDSLENGKQYLGLHQGFAEAFTFLQRSDLRQLPLGRYEISGEQIFAIVAKDQGRPADEGQLEIHNKYIDIQLLLAGTDTMGWRPRASCTQATCEYDPETDLQFFADSPDAWLAVKSGSFAIFFPEDAHLPLISTELLHKVIVKVAVE